MTESTPQQLASSPDPAAESCTWCTSSVGDCTCRLRCAVGRCQGLDPEHLCPGPSRRGHHVPTRGEPTWCRPCQALAVQALGRLPDLCSRLAPGRIARPTGDTDETRRASAAGSPSPSPAWDEIDAVIRWATDAEDRLRAHLGHSSRSGVQHRVLTRAVTYLSTHSTAWLCAPWAEADGRAVLGLARRVEVAAGADRLVHRLVAPCPACEMRGLVELSLTRDDGADHVSCRICGSSWPEAEYRRLTLVLASAVKDEAS